MPTSRITGCRRLWRVGLTVRHWAEAVCLAVASPGPRLAAACPGLRPVLGAAPASTVVQDLDDLPSETTRPPPGQQVGSAPRSSVIHLRIDCPTDCPTDPLVGFHQQKRSIVQWQRLRARPRWEQGYLERRNPDAVPGQARDPGPWSGPGDRDHSEFGSAGWDPEAKVTGWDPEASLAIVDDPPSLLETTRPPPPGQQVGPAPCSRGSVSICALLAPCSHPRNICNICMT